MTDVVGSMPFSCGSCHLQSNDFQRPRFSRRPAAAIPCGVRRVGPQEAQEAPTKSLLVLPIRLAN